MDLDRIPAIAKYLSVIFMFGWVGRSLVWNFLPVFFKQNIESVFIIGIITSLPPLVTIILDIPTGNLVQRAGEKIVIFLGLLAAIFPPVLYFSAMPALLVLGKVFEGFTKVFVWNGGWSLTLKSADDSVESETVSVFLLGINLALIIGPIIGGYLIASNGFRITFGLWLFTTLISIFLYSSYIGTDRKESLKETLEELTHRRTYFDDWRHLKNNWDNLKFPFALIFLYSIIFSFYWLAVPLLLDKVGADFKVMGLIFGAAALPKIFQFVFGNLADRVGKLETVAILAFLLTPVLVMLNYFESIIAIGVLFFLARTFSEGITPAAHAFYDSNVPDDLEGEMTGFLEFFKHSGQVLGPMIAGTVASIWSIQASFFSASIISAMIFVIAFYFRFSN